MAARVVEHGRLLAALRLHRFPVRPARREERLVPLDHSALVVVELPAADDDVVGIAGCTRPPDRLAAGLELVDRYEPVAERRIPEERVFGLRPRLEQPAEAVRVLD